MKYLVNGEEMKRCDRITIEEYGVPSLVLMERAALAVTECLTDGSFCLDRVLVVCGSGNNGGDGFAAARILWERNVAVAVLFAGNEESLSRDARIQKNICEKYGMNIGKNLDVTEYTCIVDAIFGVGLSREVGGHYRELIEKINASRADVLAVDIPSGVSADDGRVMGIAVRAKKTVTFAFEKLGQALYPGAACCGELVVQDIGITEKSFRKELPSAYFIEGTELSHLPVRRAYSNKGTYGKALIASGQKNMCGAAVLASEAAYRMGTGLVKVCTEACNRAIIQERLPEALLFTYESEISCEQADLLANWATAVCIGPGFGTGKGKWELLQLLMQSGDAPLVLDADALNLLSEHMDELKAHRRPIVVTPHIGEMQRLTGLDKTEILNDIIGTCRRFAKEYSVVCILKDARTVISDGKEICINLTGTDGMATGGSGDVLSGILTGLLAQGAQPFMAAKLAAWIHGRAGERAAKRLGRRGMLAGNIIEEMTEILREEERRNGEVR